MVEIINVCQRLEGLLVQLQRLARASIPSNGLAVRADAGHPIHKVIRDTHIVIAELRAKLAAWE